MLDLPPAYRARESLPPGRLPGSLSLTVDYFDETQPSISLTCLSSETYADVLSPAKGRALAVADLKDQDVRNRFGTFGSQFVHTERVRREHMLSQKKSQGRPHSRDRLARCDDTRRYARFFEVQLLEIAAYDRMSWCGNVTASWKKLDNA